MFSLLTLAKPICLLFHVMHLNSNLIDLRKSSQLKSEVPPTWVVGEKGEGVEVQHSPQTLIIY